MSLSFSHPEIKPPPPVYFRRNNRQQDHHHPEIGPLPPIHPETETAFPLKPRDRLTRLPVELLLIIGEFVLGSTTDGDEDDDDYDDYDYGYDYDDDDGGANSHHRVFSSEKTITSRRKDLSCLSQTCRRLRDVSQPLLFQDMRITVGQGYPLAIFLGLARTFRERPDLAKKVRFIRVFDMPYNRVHGGIHFAAWRKLMADPAYHEILGQTIQCCSSDSGGDGTTTTRVLVPFFRELVYPEPRLLRFSREEEPMMQMDWSAGASELISSHSFGERYSDLAYAGPFLFDHSFFFTLRDIFHSLPALDYTEFVGSHQVPRRLVNGRYILPKMTQPISRIIIPRFPKRTRPSSISQKPSQSSPI